ncbi:predicted thiol-disulfide oxidoreductase YuxK, DCC family [Lentimicrobium saccharophilum]|uniref:Predicted thiol-disulfide oxidoreductase YuxK, DCC family n=1 Tax=Lentimicrobium saccharophilum TaxID=1678841 RepID=A0A0S7BW91_9BACT|nr:DCC1-like thiol-disulfide oxidoreductase family protein [Lentimicrobium saccharophilum]GAP45146.1 predicted thiol-disulfide oxidoreductase YuxK, DCC family [Lentimicrobium saccharophilum]
MNKSISDKVIPSEKSLVIFDGFCILCSRATNFLLRADRKRKLFFIADPGRPAVLPSAASQAETLRGESIIFIRDGNVFSASRAVIEILITLGGGWKVFALFRIVPRQWSDFIYRYIARYRYQWFGKRSVCYMPGTLQTDRVLILNEIEKENKI